MNKVLRRGFVVSLMILSAGCGTKKIHQPLPKIAKGELNLTEMKQGLVCLSALFKPNANLQDMKRLFGRNFDESSKRFNNRTLATEYKVYLFGPEHEATVIGFNKENEYIYFVDKGGTKNPKPPRTVYVREKRSN